MSKPVKEFFTKVNKNFDVAKKLNASVDAGKRILPSETSKNDAEYQMRLDAGEMVGTRRNVVLQVNSQAKSTALKDWLKNHSSHGKLAVASYDTAAKDATAEANRVMAELEQKAKENL